MILTTADTLGKREIIEYKGLVTGIIVRTPTITQGILGRLKNIIGGKNTSYTNVCKEARLHTEQEMINQAQELGANAIVAIRYDSSSLGELLVVQRSFAMALVLLSDNILNLY
ncbi:Hypothetical protein FNO222_0943 [Francisella orientalis]|uniref:UPF0145 protein FNO190_0935 n=1 Tax=Francisella orientalis TaxID=299583 RepID=A0ABN4H0F2_9GAMM|nr:hypothetical protein OOM_1513 [Francisella orientalis str. Toba 04]AHB98400.1 hypothetical protein M973_05325 [Francisella orientalis LADL 07-285A]AKN85600.1 hypothetical protein FNO12_0935 [Francisella orientalis FNO12]AKN87140.1 Hypothetical protein FNO24_0937 [Francisella orientalis FNO24]AKN88677.1 Hypothetical protein FNO190_0935 [Francisella orientalis]